MDKIFRISLKAARVNAGMTQREAAKRIGVSLSTLQNYETGHTIPDWVTVKKIETAYGVQADNFFFHENYA